MSAGTFEPWNHEAVLRAFGELTGIVLRVVPEEVKRQAFTFAEHFSLRDLDLVIQWTKRRIARSEGGYTQASLQWRVLMGGIGRGEDLLAFQERLGLAQEEIKRGWRPVWKLCAASAPEPRKTAAVAEYDRIRMASQRRADEQRLGGPQT